MLAAVLALLSACLPVFAASATDARKAEEIGYLLDAKFAPQSLSVTVDGTRAFAVMGGAKLGGIRVDEMKLDAILKDQASAAGGLDKLASLIKESVGEITLLEKDVNDYFKSGVSTRGFSELAFDFKPSGFQAEGVFEAQMLMNLKLHLQALGNLALRSDGIYIDNVSIFAEGVKQPDMIVNLITGKINPLLPFSDIPFPVSFKRLKMTDKSVLLTGMTGKAPVGSVWRKK